MVEIQFSPFLDWVFHWIRGFTLRDILSILFQALLSVVLGGMSMNNIINNLICTVAGTVLLGCLG